MEPTTLSKQQVAARSFYFQQFVAREELRGLELTWAKLRIMFKNSNQLAIKYSSRAPYWIFV